LSSLNFLTLVKDDVTSLRFFILTNFLSGLTLTCLLLSVITGVFNTAHIFLQTIRC
jgi:hypothetical protein